MKHKFLASVAAIAAAYALTTPLYAASDKPGPGPGPNRFLERFDTNKDGKVTRDEFDGKAAGRFSDMDEDGNKAVTLSEFQAFVERKRQERLQRMFSRLDKDGSGQVTEAEFAGREGDMFARLDKNGDGVIEKSEMPKRPFHHKGPGGDGPPPGDER